MASTSLNILLNTTALTDTTTNSDAKSLANGDAGFLAIMNVSACNVATTVAGKIQSSPDRTNWFDVGSFTNVVGTTNVQEIQITRSLYPNVRAVITLSGATKAATVKVDFWYDIGG